MLVLVDVDGVVADLHTAWIEAYNAAYRDTLDPRTITEWGLWKYTKPECGKKIYDFLVGALYDRVEPMPGARQAMERLRSEGHRVVFTTACTRGTTDAKVEWLYRHHFLGGGLSTPTDFISASDKYLIQGDLLVDDGLHNIHAWQCTGRPAIIFDRTYNREAPGPRIPDWVTGTEYVLAALETPYVRTLHA